MDRKEEIEEFLEYCRDVEIFGHGLPADVAQAKAEALAELAEIEDEN